MQPCLYFSRLGKPLLYKPLSPWHITRRRRFSLPGLRPNNRRFSHNGPPRLQDISEEKLRVKSPQLSYPFVGAPGQTATIRTGNIPPRTDLPSPDPGKLELYDYSTPPVALARLLDMKDASERERYWLQIRQTSSPGSLPIITLHYLLRSSVPVTAWSSLDDSFNNAARVALNSRGMTWDDVSTWAWILSGHSPDEMAERLISSSSDQPTFVLLEILRRDISKVKTLKMLLKYAWDHLLNRLGPISSSPSETGRETMDRIVRGFQQDSSTSSRTKIDGSIPSPGYIGSFRETSTAVSRFPLIQENSFTVLISRLLYQTRRIWPPAIVSVSHMAASYLQATASSFGDSESLNPRTFARFCKMNNYFLRLMALPCSMGPLKSMVYNWSAQRVLLELAGQFDPPLRLDHASYRAVVQVLAASKKTEREVRSATFRSRSWPPWRVEQDGMDARRPRDEDLSRVISAIMRSKESGYKPDSHDEKMSIFGGLDPDGTPTIQTRKLVKWRSPNPSIQPQRSNLDVRRWAARVEATRDVHEAWGAFTEFKRQGGIPNMSMYLAMFQKIEHENRRLRWDPENCATPGDGREVIAVSDHNFSNFYRSRLQPPPLQELYQEMRGSGIRPSGRCLGFLVQHARTIDEGLRYLFDSGLDVRIVAYLTGVDKLPPDIFAQVSDQMLTDFISLLCRFVPRVVKKASDSRLEMTEPTGSSRGFSLMHLTVLEPRIRKRHHRLRRPLHHAAFLLRQRQAKFRPAWYMLFRTLAREDIILAKHLATDPDRICKTHEQAWQISRAALQEFHDCDLELDPEGFRLVCVTFAKYAKSAFHHSEKHRMAIIETSGIIKAEFAKLTAKSDELGLWIPKLLHSLNGAQLHAYVRAMGLIEDYTAIISALKWMVENHEELEAIASQSRNGHNTVRRTLIATRIFCDGTEYEDRAKELVEQVESWGGWPEEWEAQCYIDRGDMRKPNDYDNGVDGEEDEDSDNEGRREEQAGGGK